MQAPAAPEVFMQPHRMQPHEAKRVAVTTLVAGFILLAGCYQQHFDLETIDHYTYYGHAHTVDATFYHGDGADD